MGLAFAGFAGAASVRPLALGELIDTATVAFEGTCIGNRTERDPATNMVVTYTTFAVKEVLKGEVGNTHIIKQVGGKLDDGQPIFNIPGAPTFAVGADYVVFLAGVSSLGFSSPIGLAQGRFVVLPNATAGARVTNGRDFRALTADLPAATLPAAAAAARVAPQPVEQLGLDDFKQMVRARTGRPQ
jgi:hypothetical protein